MIFSRGWPSWLWSALSQGIDVKLIILSDATWISLVKTSAPASNVTVWSDVRDMSWPVVDFLFSDFDLQGKLSTLWTYITKLLVLRKAARKAPFSWKYMKVTVSHVDCGGVTDGGWWLHCYSPTMIEEIKIRPQGGGWVGRRKLWIEI
jgi:hypothetical protein